MADQHRRIYFDLSNPQLLIDWLSKHEDGPWHILITGDADGLFNLATQSRANVEWLTQQMEAGHIQIATIKRSLNIPQGLVLPPIQTESLEVTPKAMEWARRKIEELGLDKGIDEES